PALPARAPDRRHALPRQRVVAGFELAGLQPVLPREARPDRPVDALRVQVPARAATAGPDPAFEFALDVGVELVLDLGPDLDGLGLLVLGVGDGLADVADLLLDHEHDRVVPQPGVGPEQQEQVRKARHRDALVGLHALGRPQLAEVLAAGAHDVQVVEGVGHVETGAVDDHIDVVFDAGLVDDAVRLHLGDAVGDDVHVVPAQRRVVVV